MPDPLLIIFLVVLIYVAVRRLSAPRYRGGVVFHGEPAELGPGTVTSEFVLGDDEWIGQVLFDGVKWSAVLQFPQNGIPGIGSNVTVVGITHRNDGSFSRPMAEVIWLSPIPPEQ